MLKMLRIEERVAITGGGAKNIGLVWELEKKLDTKAIVPEEPQLIGAYGAALFALEMAQKKGR
jgi:activator of 2-hydroxyglutaryl-CoA dehydratase